VRPNLTLVADRAQQVVDLVDERMLPADDVTGRPPTLHEGVVRVGDVHGLKSGGRAGIDAQP
jgi:hypothetical protein